MTEISYQVRIIIARNDNPDYEPPTNHEIEDVILAAIRLELNLKNVTVSSERLDR